MKLTDTIHFTENQKRLAEILIHTYMHEGDSRPRATDKAWKRIIQRYRLDRRHRAS